MVTYLEDTNCRKRVVIRKLVTGTLPLVVHLHILELVVLHHTQHHMLAADTTCQAEVRCK